MQYSRAHNVCVYDTNAPAAITTAIADAVRLAPEKVAVPCTLHNMQLMRHMGYQVMPPILTDYDWPIRPPLRPFIQQKTTAAFMIMHPRCFNLNDIGTGKTLSVLWAMDYLMLKGAVKKVIVVTTLSTTEDTWLKEIQANFLSRRKGVVVVGSREKRLAVLKKDADFYIINHDGLGVGSAANKLGSVAEFIRDNPDFNAVIVDEGTAYKHGTSFRTKIIKEVAKASAYLWWLTGTPALGAPTDAWAQAKIVRTDYTESFNAFRDRTMLRVSHFTWKPRKDAPAIVAEVLQPAIRFDRKDCIDLPPLMTVDRQVELSTSQKTAYADLKRQLRLIMKDGGTVNAVNEAALRMKLIQISCGAVYGDQHEVHKVDCAPRIAGLREVLDQCNEKILIFAPLTSIVNMLHKELSADYSVEIINGTVSQARRTEVFRNFQTAGNPRIIVADPRTMAHGLTLTAASAIIWYGPTDQPEIYTQANGRINRPGQTKSMLVVRLQSTNIEREIYRRLDGKQGLQGLMLDIIRGEEV